MDPNRVILIAEDSEDDVDLLKIAFRRVGLKNPIQVVRDGQEAIDYLSRSGQYEDRLRFPFPGIIFLDLKMPRKTGLEVLAWLSEHPECYIIPTMIFTSSSQESDVVRAYQLGANCYMVKPGSLEELIDCLRATMAFWNRCLIPALPQVC
jgi:CheY-like chemotaxis protein